MYNEAFTIIVTLLYPVPLLVGTSDSTDWTTATVVTASLFMVTLVVTVVVFVLLFILLRQRAASHAVNAV